jgi:Spy/CpxP family protein refolding chaperone
MRSDTLKSIIAREADIKTARLELNDILHQPNPNLREARSRVKKVSDLQLGIRLSLLDSYERSLGVLSKEQKDRFFKQMPVPGPHRFDEEIIGPDSSAED